MVNTKRDTLLPTTGPMGPKGLLGLSHLAARRRQIKMRRKLYEFFVAPITTFWAWFGSFVVFLCALTYVLLIKSPPKPTMVE